MGLLSTFLLRDLHLSELLLFPRSNTSSLLDAFCLCDGESDRRCSHHSSMVSRSFQGHISITEESHFPMLTLMSPVLITHQWYLDRFKGIYPSQRKAISPAYSDEPFGFNFVIIRLLLLYVRWYIYLVQLCFAIRYSFSLCSISVLFRLVHSGSDRGFIR